MAETYIDAKDLAMIRMVEQSDASATEKAEVIAFIRHCAFLGATFKTGTLIGDLLRISRPHGPETEADRYQACLRLTARIPLPNGMSREEAAATIFLAVGERYSPTGPKRKEFIPADKPWKEFAVWVVEQVWVKAKKIPPLHSVASALPDETLEAAYDSAQLLSLAYTHASPAQKRILRMKEQGLTDDEIAVQLGCSPVTVRSQLTRLRKKIRAT